MKHRKTLDEMARGDKPQETCAGKPADRCPYCGAGMVGYGVNRTKYEIVRYIICRNQSCRKRFVSRQPPAHIIKEIKPDSTDGNSSMEFRIRFA